MYLYTWLFLLLTLKLGSTRNPNENKVEIPVCCSPTGLWNQTAEICVVHAPEVSSEDLRSMGFPEGYPYNLTDRYPKCQNQFYQLDPYTKSSDNFTLTYDGYLYVNE